MKKRAAAATLVFLLIVLVSLIVLDLRPADIFSSLNPFELFTHGERTAEVQPSAVADPSPQEAPSTPASGESFMATGTLMDASGSSSTPESYSAEYQSVVALAPWMSEGSRESRIEVSSGDFDFLAHYGAGPLPDGGRFAFNPLAPGQGFQAWMGPGEGGVFAGLALDPTMLAMSSPLVSGGLTSGDGGAAPTPQPGTVQAPNRPVNPGTPQAAVPEPSTLTLLAGGLAGLAAFWSLRKIL